MCKSINDRIGISIGDEANKISPYNSKANGKVKNIHKTVKTMLCAYMKEFKTNWDLLLPLVEFAMNTSRNINTGYTPFFLHFGRHLNMPLDYYYGDILLDDVDMQIIYGNNTHSLNSLFFFPSFYSLLLLLYDRITFSKCTLLRLRPPLLPIH